MTKRSPEPEGVASYPLDYLVKEAGVTVRTVRHYVNKGVLPRREYGHWFFNYDEAFRQRLLAVVRLRKKGERLDAIRRRLDASTPDQIAVLAGLARPAGSPETLNERWERIPLRAGLELHLRADAHPEVVTLARQLEQQLRRR